ncbi:VOC family protein [Pelagicoccus mobilis]|uniref:VOC family protein n=1 Tax=Pelagicoccus mobilis TaxID=415221 RepID=A0A934RV81_9BACT|nr:VOC family protein [Pelagicoccus mobilis]MBK1877076.1 VOC family protein [Pelagicoccus mobilis]
MLELDHIALLVRDLEATAASFPSTLERHELETFESEGTKEQYIDFLNTNAPSLLLFEAIGDGPYRRALKKRGPGLHHLGYRTTDLKEAVAYFAKQGLFLHPISIDSLEKRVAWMCRPGIPFLVEIFESERANGESSEQAVIRTPNASKEISWAPGLILLPGESSGIGITVGEEKVWIEIVK